MRLALRSKTPRSTSGSSASTPSSASLPISPSITGAAGSWPIRSAARNRATTSSRASAPTARRSPSTSARSSSTMASSAISSPSTTAILARRRWPRSSWRSPTRAATTKTTTRN